MTETKHTPGPWVARPTNPLDGFDGWRLETQKGGDIGTLNGCQRQPRRQANAHLIAAAPDLLDAVEWCIEALEYDYHGTAEDCEIPDYVRAAIAKAKGEAE